MTLPQFLPDEARRNANGSFAIPMQSGAPGFGPCSEIPGAHRLHAFWRQRASPLGKSEISLVDATTRPQFFRSKLGRFLVDRSPDPIASARRSRRTVCRS